MQVFSFTEQGESNRFKVTDSCGLMLECHIPLWLRSHWIHTNKNMFSVKKVKIKVVASFLFHHSVWQISVFSLSGIIHRHCTLELQNRLKYHKENLVWSLDYLAFRWILSFLYFASQIQMTGTGNFPCINHYTARVNSPLALSGLGLVLNRVQFD